MIKLLSRYFIKDSENYSDASVRNSYGVLTGIVGIVLNIFLFIGKFIAGIITGAISIIADAFNNLSDAGSSIITMIGYKIASRPADKEHPFGHGRVEYIAGFVVSIIIILTGFELGKGSVEKIFLPEEMNFSVVSLIILAVSILVKFYIFAYNRKIGKLINSSPMRAAALDSLSDCISTAAVIIGLIVFLVFNINIDGYIGLIVALFILKTGIEAVKESIAPLLGESADAEYINGIKDTILSYENIVGVHDMIVHNYGVGANIISMHAEVPAEMGFVEAHEMIDMVENELMKKYGGIVTIHMDPIEKDTEHSIMYKKLISDILSEIDSNLSIHDFRMTDGHTYRNLLFDIEVPFGMKMSDNEIKDIVIKRIKDYDVNLNPVITIDKKVY